MSFTLTFEVTDEMVVSAIETAQDYLGLTLTPTDIERLCRDDLDYLDEVLQMSTGDTYARDLLTDLLAKEAGFDHWPFNGDRDEYKEKFRKDFAAYANKAGWKAGARWEHSWA